MNADRRNRLTTIISELEEIAGEEDDAYQNMPENMQNGERKKISKAGLLIYACPACDTTTEHPNWSDASRERIDPDTGIVALDGEHIPICPECHRRCAVRCDDNTEEFVWATH